MKTISLVMAAAALGAVSLEGQVSANDRFQLFTECSPVSVSVTVEQKAMELEELTKSSVRPIVSSRLRSARLYTDDPDPSFPELAVSVVVAGRVGYVAIDLMKRVQDPLTSLSAAAQTWRRSVVGVHGGSASGLQTAVAQLMDVFLDEYLRVNTEACDSARPEAGGAREATGEVRWSGRVH